MSCCAIGPCSRPGVCATCRWIGYLLVSCPTQLPEGRCTKIAGHPGKCEAERKAKKAEAA